VEFSKPEQRIYDPVSKLSHMRVGPLSKVPCVDGSIGRQWLFAAAAPQLGRPPEVPEIAHTDRDGSPYREALGREGERQPYWTAGDIVTTRGKSVEAAGIATVAADSKRGRPREEDRKTAGTVNDDN
jgi:hypothetical protein